MAERSKYSRPAAGPKLVHVGNQRPSLLFCVEPLDSSESVLSVVATGYEYLTLEHTGRGPRPRVGQSEMEREGGEEVGV